MEKSYMDDFRIEADKVLFWLNDERLQGIFSSRYWNDQDIEKGKEWYILDGDTKKLIEYLKEKTTYFQEYESIIRFAENKGLKIKGTGLDLAAGVCWTTALLSRIATVEKIYAIDISKHRILKIAPRVFELFNADTKKITRVIGDFYDMKLADSSMDFCLMSQAFHHADNPNRLLLEVYRVLKPQGIVLIIGERPVYPKDFFKRCLKNTIKLLTPWFIRYKNKAIYKLFPSFVDLYPPDRLTGDHFYSIKKYHDAFKSNKFVLYEDRNPAFTKFMAVKQ